MPTITFDIGETLHEKLKLVSKISGIPMSRLAEQAVAAKIDEHIQSERFTQETRTFFKGITDIVDLLEKNGVILGREATGVDGADDALGGGRGGSEGPEREATGAEDASGRIAAHAEQAYKYTSDFGRFADPEAGDQSDHGAGAESPTPEREDGGGRKSQESITYPAIDPNKPPIVGKDPWKGV